MTAITVNTHALAHNLRGFGPSSTLRVFVTRIDEASGNVWVRTADLCDAGTPLVLDINQVEPETVEPEPEPAYEQVGADVRGPNGRFYCTMAAWPYSPAARSGATLRAA